MINHLNDLHIKLYFDYPLKEKNKNDILLIAKTVTKKLFWLSKW